MVRVTGFGQTGPYAKRAGYGAIGGPALGADNDCVYGELLRLDETRRAALKSAGIF